MTQDYGLPPYKLALVRMVCERELGKALEECTAAELRSLEHLLGAQAAVLEERVSHLQARAGWREMIAAGIDEAEAWANGGGGR